MTVRVYYSTDSGAPVYSGSAGALIAVLQACLVDGYGAKAAAGWTKPFTGTNLAAFRPAAGNRHYLRVDDTNTTAARVRGFEVMADVNTGTGPFPTDVQVSGGCYTVKSNAASSDARGWVVVADEKRFWLVSAQAVSTIAASTDIGLGMFFGDIVSAKAGDAFHTLLIAGASSEASAVQIGGVVTSISASLAGHYMARAYTQMGASITVGKHSDNTKLIGATTVGSSGSAYPDPVTGGIGIAPLFVHENGPSVTRGVLPGAWCPVHYLPASPGDIFQGSGAHTGKEFLLVDVSASGSRGRMALEISDTWS